MSYKGSNILAVIPARGGSKGIPRKNLCKVGGISLVGHAVTAARSLDWIDRTIVSTDDEQIAAEGRKYGAAVPFMRPAELASDQARSTDMWQQAWLASEDHFKETYDISILLEPTSPLRRPQDILDTVDTLIESGCDAAATFSRAPAHSAVQHSPENPGLLLSQWYLLCRPTPYPAGKRDDHRRKLQGRNHRKTGC
ncbi:MAG: acylneuraminate cytidylyltransferase family protein [Desulfobacterales bacterium]